MQKLKLPQKSLFILSRGRGNHVTEREEKKVDPQNPGILDRPLLVPDSKMSDLKSKEGRKREKKARLAKR
jgi:hypothetical protein